MDQLEDTEGGTDPVSILLGRKGNNSSTSLEQRLSTNSVNIQEMAKQIIAKDEIIEQMRKERQECENKITVLEKQVEKYQQWYKKNRDVAKEDGASSKQNKCGNNVSMHINEQIQLVKHQNAILEQKLAEMQQKLSDAEKVNEEQEALINNLRLEQKNSRVPKLLKQQEH